MNRIQNDIMSDPQSADYGLSTSGVAEWVLITETISRTMESFETAYRVFENEVDEKTERVNAGTTAWYAEMSRRFQSPNGNDPQYREKTTLQYEPATGMYGYEVVDAASRIISVVSVSEDFDNKRIHIKLAKTNDEGSLVPLDDSEVVLFSNYIRRIAMAGIRVAATSLTADHIRFRMAVYHDPQYNGETVRREVEQALEEFKSSLSFDSVLYTQQLIDAAMHVTGVVTVDLQELLHSRYELVSGEMTPYQPVRRMAALEAGYFEYDNTKPGYGVEALSAKKLEEQEG